MRTKAIILGDFYPRFKYGVVRMGDYSWNADVVDWKQVRKRSDTGEHVQPIAVFNRSHPPTKKSSANHHGYAVSSTRTGSFKVWIKCRIQRQGLISHENSREISIDVYVCGLGQTNGSEVIEHGRCKRWVGMFGRISRLNPNHKLA